MAPFLKGNEIVSLDLIIQKLNIYYRYSCCDQRLSQLVSRQDMQLFLREMTGGLHIFWKRGINDGGEGSGLSK